MDKVSPLILSLVRLHIFCIDQNEFSSMDVLASLEYPTMPPAGSSKVLRAPARWVGIRRAPKTKIYNLETGE